MRPTPASEESTLVHSYLFMRRAIGFIGVGLPLALIVGKLVVDGGGLLGSISGYYYTGVRGVFVGAMCAVGVFLLSYRGYGLLDDIAADIAGVAAIGVAWFPTTPAGPVTGTQRLVGDIHLTSAAVFFLTLSFFCFFVFTKTDVDSVPTPRKLWRNRVYLASGATILLCLVLVVVIGLVVGNQSEWAHPMLWLESVAILAFGVSWVTKGEAILADLPPTAQIAPKVALA
jgi:hypothetical protein